MIKDNQTLDRIEGFDELGGRDDFTTDTLEVRLAKNGLIDLEEKAFSKFQQNKKPNQTSKANPLGKPIYSSFSNRKADDSDNEENEESDPEADIL